MIHRYIFPEMQDRSDGLIQNGVYHKFITAIKKDLTKLS